MIVPTPLRPWARGEVRAQTSEEARGFDARAIEELGVPQPVLMENAGRAAAQVLTRLYGPPRAADDRALPTREGRDASGDSDPRSRLRVVGLIGGGNNGGDGLVVLRTLAAWGHEVIGVMVADRPTDDPLLHGWTLDLRSDEALTGAELGGLFETADVIVDALLGTGASGAPRPRQARVIEAANASTCPVVALDVPSGVDATTGGVSGVSVRAAVTVAFGAPKIGTMVQPGRGRTGRLVCVEIGFPPLGPADASSLVVTPSWARSRIPRRAGDAHKNQVGRVLVIGGQAGMAGAVILAARAAFRTGAGLVRICSDSGNRAAVQSAVPEAMFLSFADAEAVTTALAASDAVVIGPGLGTGDAAAAVLRRVVGHPDTTDDPPPELPLLLDADALNLAAEGACDLARVGSRRPVLVTPHPGEMRRLLGPGADDEASGGARRLASAAATRFGVTVLFKGAPSIVVTPDGETFVDTQNSSALAVAGMGDTLSGVCGTLLAQGLDAATAGAVGLYLSGRAALLSSRGAGMTPSDVVERLPDALGETRAPATVLDLPFVSFDADAAG